MRAIRWWIRSRARASRIDARAQLGVVSLELRDCRMSLTDRLRARARATIAARWTRAHAVTRMSRAQCSLTDMHAVAPMDQSLSETVVRRQNASVTRARTDNARARARVQSLRPDSATIRVWIAQYNMLDRLFAYSLFGYIRTGYGMMDSDQICKPDQTGSVRRGCACIQSLVMSRFTASMDRVWIDNGQRHVCVRHDRRLLLQYVCAVCTLYVGWIVGGCLFAIQVRRICSHGGYATGYKLVVRSCAQSLRIDFAVGALSS